MNIVFNLSKWFGMLLLIAISGCASVSHNENKDSNEAINDTRSSIDIKTTDIAQENRPSDIYAQMGLEYMKAGQPDVALRKLNHGLSLDPNNAQIYAVLGRLYESLGKIQQAEKYYIRSIELDPHNPFSRNAWGGFLCQKGEYVQAEIEFRKVLDDPFYNQPWDASTNAGVCALRAGQKDKAERYLRSALNSNPNIPLALFKLSQLLVDAQKYAEAQTYLTRYEQLVGLSLQSLLLQYKTAVGLKDKAAAMRFQEMLKLRFPNAPETQSIRELKQP